MIQILGFVLLRPEYSETIAIIRPLQVLSEVPFVFSSLCMQPDSVLLFNLEFVLHV